MEISEYYNNCLQIIKEKGYMIKVVKTNKKTVPYSYTIGRELVGKSDFVVMNMINETIIDSVIEKFDEIMLNSKGSNYKSTLVVSLDSLTINGKPLRFKVIKLDPVKHKQLCSGCWNKSFEVKEPIGLYQIMYPDDKNIIPGEKGFNEIYKQPDLSV